MSHGLVLGKFLPYHEGHAHLIRAARAQVDALTVLVCSLERDTIPGTLRYEWVSTSHPDCRVIHVDEEVPQAPEDSPDFWPVWVDLVQRRAGTVDVVFTSEDYGDELGRRVGARHVSVDRARRTVPVSGTQVRTDPMKHWRFLPRVVRPYFAKRVAILGTESTGKTTLARRLAERFETSCAAEYGRAYCEGRDARLLQLSDFDAIARGQIAAEDAAALDANRVLICDTELHTTCTWSDHTVGRRPDWLTAAARERRYDLVLLLAPDVPWVNDGTRVLQGRGTEHTARLRAELESAGKDYHVVGGSWEERFAQAERRIARLLESG